VTSGNSPAMGGSTDKCGRDPRAAVGSRGWAKASRVSAHPPRTGRMFSSEPCAFVDDYVGATPAGGSARLIRYKTRSTATALSGRGRSYRPTWAMSQFFVMFFFYREGIPYDGYAAL